MMCFLICIPTNQNLFIINNRITLTPIPDTYFPQYPMLLFEKQAKMTSNPIFE
jgi:hypothetical protein